MEHPFIGYAPDLDPTTPGIIIDCQNVIPSMKGMRSAFSAQSTTLPALATRARGGASIRRLNETSRLIIGTQTRLFEAGASSYSDVSRTTGGTYSCAADQLWTFAQFGNVTIASQKADKIQASTAGFFADIATAPKAGSVETVGQFVFAFDTSETAYGDSPDRWWCSAIGDHTDWTPAVATQCATGRLIAGDGKITCGKRFGDRIVAFKRNAMYLGSYTGAPFVWDWQQVQGSIGCLGKTAAVDVGTAEEPRLLFMGSDNFYAFDGSRVEPIGNMVRETVFGALALSNADICTTVHDRVQKLVYFFYSTGSDPVCNACVVYHYVSGRWGRADATIETALDFISAGVTYDALGSLYSTYSDLPNVLYDSALFIAQSVAPSVVDSSRLLKTLDGGASVGYLQTGVIGSDQAFSLVRRVTPRWFQKPTVSEMTAYTRTDLGEMNVANQTVQLSNGRYDVLQRANWHSFKVSWTAGAWEAAGLNVEIQGAGKE
jgi:hypothetical protein